VDGVIFVVRAESTSKDYAVKALQSIEKNKIIGIVFNQLDVKQSSYYSTTITTTGTTKSDGTGDPGMPCIYYYTVTKIVQF